MQVQLESLRKENSSLKGKYQEKQKALRVEAQRLQEKLDEALLGQRKLEEEVLVLREESPSFEMSGAELLSLNLLWRPSNSNIAKR